MKTNSQTMISIFLELWLLSAKNLYGSNYWIQVARTVGKNGSNTTSQKQNFNKKKIISLIAKNDDSVGGDQYRRAEIAIHGVRLIDCTFSIASYT